MDRLHNLAKDKFTMADLREYFRKHLEQKILIKVFQKQSVAGYAEASEVINSALNELEADVAKKPVINLNQSE